MHFTFKKPSDSHAATRRNARMMARPLAGLSACWVLAATAFAAEATPPAPTEAKPVGEAMRAAIKAVPVGKTEPPELTALKTGRSKAPLAEMKPPTEAQIRALDLLRTESEAYERSGRDYRESIASIVRLHYDTKKKLALSALDANIEIEKGELSRARENAIARLEDFVKTYAAGRSDPDSSPDAMFRLAALYEEKARMAEGPNDNLDDGLTPAINLYRRIIAEYPSYKQLASVHYFLGHAYNDAGRLDESQQVWRALVCANRYPYNPNKQDPKRPGHDLIMPMPQDHDEQYWSQWRVRYQRPESLAAGGEETKYLDPFPTSCKPLVQPELLPGEDPKYVAEIWWQIGNWEFDQLDAGSGVVRDEPASVYGFNRAASAYTRAMSYKKPPIYGVSLYKYAWTLFKQQRFEEATRQFVELLKYTDEQEKLTGDPGADFRSEAFTYIAGSLTNVDFVGPKADEPYIPRPDILETESRTDVAEKKLHVGVDRVADAALIPQDRAWSIEIYKALASEYRGINQFQNAVEVYSAILQKWPLDASAPEVQASIADTYDQMNISKKPGTPEHEVITAKALDARTKLSDYIGTTAWTTANKDNASALRKAERMVRGRLRQAAVQHTNNGRQLVTSAADTSDEDRQADLLGRSLAEYKLAAAGWQGFLDQEPNAPDAYESRYWLADSLHQTTRIAAVLHRMVPAQYALPTDKEITTARDAALYVRDSNEDDKYLDNSAYFVVSLADVRRDIAYQAGEAGQPGGIKRIEKLELTGGENDEPQKVVVTPVPKEILQSIAARDDYMTTVPPRSDKGGRIADYEFYSAETFFLYGQFAEARRRYVVMYERECGKSDYGYRAWEKLITMSNIERDVEQSRLLAEAEKASGCAVSTADKEKSALIVNPTLQEASYIRARQKFQEAQKAPDGPGKDALWREAAGMYEAALSAAPGRDEAPEAAMNSAYAYKQVGEYGKAIELYGKFISEYGNEAKLAALEKGSKDKPAEPKKYQERLKYLNDAYDALGTTYYSFFNYQRAAETYERVSGNTRFSLEKRKVAATNAMVLYSNLGQREKMLGEYTKLKALSPTAEEKATADYLVASYDYKLWDPNGADSGANRNARVAAESTLASYYAKNKGDAAASKYVVESAYRIAKMRRSVGDAAYRTWYKSTIAAWESANARGGGDKNPVRSPPYVDYAAEADFKLLDEQITPAYDIDEKHKYTGSVADVLGAFDPKTGKQKSLGKYQKNAADADKWDKELDRISRTYPSLEWIPAVIARQGSIWDRLRTGLYGATPPAIKYFTAKQESLLKKLEDSGRPELEDQASELRDGAREGWRKKKELELSASDELMVKRYAQAVAIARRYNVRNPQVEKAIRRLAYFTDIIGDAKVRDYVTRAKDPGDPATNLTYSDGQFVQSRPGQTVVPPAYGVGVQSPVAP